MTHVRGCIQGKTQDGRSCWQQDAQISWHPGASAGVYRITELPGETPRVAFFSSVAESNVIRPDVCIDEELEPDPPAATMLGVPITEAERQRISKDGA